MGEAATGTERHPGEGALIRVLDGEEDVSAVREHVVACDECRARYERLAAWSEGISGSLAAADPIIREASQRRWREQGGSRNVPRWLKVAAGIVLLLSGTLAVEPVRAWVLSQAEAVAQRLEIAARTSDTPNLRAPRGASVSFVPAGSNLVIRFESPQRAGRLVIAASTGSTEVRASVLAPPGSIPTEFTVLPSQLSIRNEPNSRAEYRVIVPSALESVEVEVGDSTVARVSGETLQAVERWTLNLQSRQRGGTE